MSTGGSAGTVGNSGTPLEVTVDAADFPDDAEFEILCDDTGVFLRAYSVDASGTTTTTDTELDGTTAHAVVGTVRVCPPDEAGPISIVVTGQPIVVTNPVGDPIDIEGTVTVANNRDDEYQILCDAGAANLPFLRRYRTDSVGVVTSANFTLDGTTPYVLIGAAVRCSAITAATLPLPAGAATNASQRDDEYKILCDTVGTFLRRYRTSSAGAITITDTTLNGTTAYVPVGAVTVCPESISNFPSDREFQVLCDAGAADLAFLRRYNTTTAGVVTPTDTLLDGTTVYAPVGPVVTCSSGGGAAGDDSELEILCDSGTSPSTRFLRRYLYDSSGTFLGSLDTELDGTTAYAPIGTVGACPEAGPVPVDMCDTFVQQDLWATQQAGTVDLISVNPITGAKTIILDDFTTELVNALAWDPIRRMLYGVDGNDDLWEIDPFAPSATNLGAVTGLPAATWIFGAYDLNTRSYYISTNSQAVYRVDVDTFAAVRASSFVLPAGGSGDIAFDFCGRMYASQDGVIRRYDSLFDTLPRVIATVPTNGSGFSGAGYWKAGRFIGAFGDGEIFAVNTRTGVQQTGLGPITGGGLLDFAADPRHTVSVPFTRVFDVNPDGTLGSFEDYQADGTPYAPAGVVTVGICEWCCDCSEEDQAAPGNPVGVTNTLVTGGGGGAFTTSINARRVQAWFQTQPALGRDTVNGVSVIDSSSDAILAWGDLSVAGHVPALTFVANGGRSIFVSQEF